MGSIRELLNDLAERDLRDLQPALRIFSRYHRVLEVGCILPTLVRRAEPILDPPVRRGVELRFKQCDNAHWDEKDYPHHGTVQLQESYSVTINGRSTLQRTLVYASSLMKYLRLI